MIKQKKTNEKKHDKTKKTKEGYRCVRHKIHLFFIITLFSNKRLIRHHITFTSFLCHAPSH